MSKKKKKNSFWNKAKKGVEKGLDKGTEMALDGLVVAASSTRVLREIIQRKHF